MKYFLLLLLTVLSFGIQAQIRVEYEEHDILLNAMTSQSLHSQNELNDPNTIYTASQEADNDDSCLWGGWISTKDTYGRCQAPYRLDVYNDPYIKSFGPTYDTSMRCGSASSYRCNPIIFGTGTGAHERGYCVNIPRAESALLMAACKEASRANSQEHLEKLKTNPQLLGHYINQAAEIASICQQNGNQCGNLVDTLIEEIRPAVSCYQSSDLFPYILSSSNLATIDQLTGTLGTEYSRYLERLMADRNRAISHNRELLDRAISSYSNSDEIRRMYARLRQNFTVHYNKNRRRIGSKSRGTSVGRCLMYTKMALLSAGFFSQYPPVASAKDFGPQLERAGFSNLMNVPGFEDITPENAPAGAVIVYRGGQHGHIEVKMDDGTFGSDFVKNAPISDYMSRTPIGIYVKIPNVDGMVEVPNE